MTSKDRAAAATSKKKIGTGKRKGPRRHRPRPVPKWIKEQKEMDDMARRRCLLVLRVLSGQVPVTDAIEEAEMSRATYYKLEERALRGMLAALSPTAGPEGTEDSALEQARNRVVELEDKVKEMDKERRRSERLALLTRKLIKAGPLVMQNRGRRATRAATPNSTPSGPNSSNSPGPTKQTTPATEHQNSTPKQGGAAGR